MDDIIKFDVSGMHCCHRLMLLECWHFSLQTSFTTNTPQTASLMAKVSSLGLVVEESGRPPPSVHSGQQCHRTAGLAVEHHIRKCTDSGRFAVLPLNLVTHKFLWWVGVVTV